MHRQRGSATHHDKQKPHKGIGGGDPFVIAFGKGRRRARDRRRRRAPGSGENRKIPFVCNAEGVTCITFQQMILADGWKF